MAGFETDEKQLEQPASRRGLVAVASPTFNEILESETTDHVGRIATNAVWTTPVDATGTTSADWPPPTGSRSCRARNLETGCLARLVGAVARARRTNFTDGRGAALFQVVPFDDSPTMDRCREVS